VEVLIVSYSNPIKIERITVGLGKSHCRRAQWHFLPGIILLLAGTGLAQNRTNPTSAPAPSIPAGQPAGVPTGVLVNPDEDYRLAPGDTIEITVDDAAELSQVHRLTAAGTFEMQFLGVIKAQGQTTHELARFIATQLREQDYLKQPQVKVNIKAIQRANLFHSGRRAAAWFVSDGRAPLVAQTDQFGGRTDGALQLHGFHLTPYQESYTPSEAQPVSANANQVAQNSTGNAGSSDDNEQYEFIKVPLTPIFQQGRFDQNVRLEPATS
jgi:hypothetical protein